MMPPNDAPPHTLLNQTNLSRSTLLYICIPYSEQHYNGQDDCL